MHRKPQLLVEVRSVPITILSESGADGKANMKVKVGLMEADVINNNNRFYKRGILEREVGRMQDRIQRRVAYGSGDHPSDGKTNFENVSHVWDKVWMEGAEIFGEATIFNTDRGRNVQEVVRVTGTLPASARGFGTCTPGDCGGKTADIVEDTYQLASFDFVLGEPGFDGAKVLQVSEEAAAGGDGTMDLKELREKHPDLVKALVDETTAAVTAAVITELTKAFETKVLDKVKQHKDLIRESVVKEVVKEYGIEAMQEAFASIAEAVAPFLEEEIKPGKTAAPKKEDNSLFAEALKKMETELAGFKMQLTAKNEEVAKLAAELELAKVPSHIAEVTKLEPGNKYLTEGLKGCKTIAEVNERLPVEKAKVTELLKNNPELKGKGTVAPESNGDKPMLTEEQKRQQRLAGVAVNE